ncbi:NAD-dependent epimerase/dehydratase family protein [Halomicronema sp. CCY15110]|uniref:NAD-dependent epimerase/dehydratase family protein n=1 Tax=Halomicronema sp. CCY15110 TaxID=2767773 RepID=UPI00194E049E|nr:NAD-dependent epimerase/dehydratase family protein [Halomicronema sp. CCY15110]
MKVFLTSATGYIGGAVARSLMNSGHAVVGLARSAAAAQRLQDAGIQPHRGDLTDAASLQAAAIQADAVIHTAATNDAAMPTVDQQATQVLLAALADTPKPFVYTSGIWVMGNTKGQVADETWPFDPTPIVAWRPAVEELVLAAAQAGVRSLVIRPGLVYGHGGGLLAMLRQTGQATGAVPMIESGDYHGAFVHVDDLARLYVQAMESAPAGTVLIGANDAAITMGQVADAIAQSLGMDGQVQSLSLANARERWGALADALALDQQVTSDRAHQLLGWQPTAISVLDDLIQESDRSEAIAA